MSRVSAVASATALILAGCTSRSVPPTIVDFGAFALSVPPNDGICGAARSTDGDIVYTIPRPNGGNCEEPGINVLVAADAQPAAAIGVPFRAEAKFQDLLSRATPRERYVLGYFRAVPPAPFELERGLAWSGCQETCVMAFRYRSAVVRVIWDREAVPMPPQDVASLILNQLRRWSSSDD